MAVADDLAEMLATVLENLPEPLLLVDSLGNVVLRNKASRDMTGASQGESMNVWDRNNLTLWYEDGRPVPREEYPARRLLRGLPLAGELYRAETRDGRRLWVEAKGLCIPAPDFPGVCIVSYRDVSRVHETREAQLDYFRAVSHDLRSPLAIVSAQAQILLRSLQEKSLWAEARRAQDVVLTAERMNLMIESLSDSIRAESGQVELHRALVDLGELTRGVVERMAVLGNDRIRLFLPPGPVLVSVDEPKVERCVQNMVSNALRYSPASLPVDVRVSMEDGCALVDVEDRGPGIEPQDLPFIFHRFYRGRASAGVEGIGLGLYVSRLTAEAHGGGIFVSSSLGRGSVFTLRLPAL